MYRRRLSSDIESRLSDTRGFIQVVLGPRQVGKTTAVKQALDALGIPAHYATADSPTPLPAVWLQQQWSMARALAADGTPVVLALDEIQKIDGWADAVKLERERDAALRADVRVVVLGSSALLVHRGMSESLAGRFEVLRATHWTFSEMRDAFGWDLDRFIYFGGYPGAAALIDDEPRWQAYILDSLIETAIARDVLMLSRVDKPALLRQLFALACSYSGQELSYTKMLGQLSGAGNTTTLAHYLELLSLAGLVTGLQKHSGHTVRRRASSPKLLALNTALVSAMSGRDLESARSDAAFWGRLVETAVGAHLIARAQRTGGEVRYWRDSSLEVDFVVESPGELSAIEVKSGGNVSAADLRGLQAFAERFGSAKSVVVGTGGVELGQFLGGS